MKEPIYVPTVKGQIIILLLSIAIIACFSLRFTQDKKVVHIEIKCDSICNDTIVI